MSDRAAYIGTGAGASSGNLRPPEDGPAFKDGGVVRFLHGRGVGWLSAPKHGRNGIFYLPHTQELPYPTGEKGHMAFFGYIKAAGEKLFDAGSASDPTQSFGARYAR